MSDIKKFAVAQTSRLHLRDAAEELMYAEDAEGKPDQNKPMAANIYGPGSKQYAKAKAAQSNRFVNDLKRKGKADKSAEESARELAEFLAACTESFEHIDYEGLAGDALYKAVYADREIGFIADQIGKHLGEWANFTKSSPTS